MDNKDNSHCKSIEASCPKCGCPAEEIEHYNSGPIVRIRCPKCAFGVNEAMAREAGYTDPEGLFEYWNQLT